MNTHERLLNLIYCATEAGYIEAADEYRAELADYLAGDTHGSEDDCVCQAEGY